MMPDHVFIVHQSPLLNFPPILILCSAYTLNMTSQRWLTDADFSEGSQSGSIWTHFLVVIVPDNLKFTNNATLWITGGNTGSMPHQGDEDITVCASLATNTGMITGSLFQVTNTTLFPQFVFDVCI
jgi:PhoPQ-activated pathogenicity-related protein